MIVSKKKPIDEIREALQGVSRVIILGCSECAAMCQTGGSEQVKEMVEVLQDDYEIIATISIDSPCDQRLARRGFKRVRRELETADAILSLSCGSGVQSVAEVTEKPVIAGLNTYFLGMTERLGKFYERCRHCGDCLLNHTDGLCPVTACPKSLRNGPCEGERDGKCEVSGVGDCVWALIIDKQLEKQKKALERFNPPLSHIDASSAQQWVWKSEEEK